MARVARSDPDTYKEFQILWQSLLEQNFEFLSIRGGSFSQSRVSQPMEKSPLCFVEFRKKTTAERKGWNHECQTLVIHA